MSSAVIVSLRVKASPVRAFDVFTQEIALWWRPNPLFQLTPRGDGVLRFEGGEGGRLITALPGGREFEIGRVSAWARGQRLAFSWKPATFSEALSTQVIVSFEATAEETRITVEHRGWNEIPRDHVARHGFPLGQFQLRLGEHWRVLLESLSHVASRFKG